MTRFRPQQQGRTISRKWRRSKFAVRALSPPAARAAAGSPGPVREQACRTRRACATLPSLARSKVLTSHSHGAHRSSEPHGFSNSPTPSACPCMCSTVSSVTAAGIARILSNQSTVEDVGHAARKYRRRSVCFAHVTGSRKNTSALAGTNGFFTRSASSSTSGTMLARCRTEPSTPTL